MKRFARKAVPLLFSAVAIAASGGAQAQADVNLSAGSTPAASSPAPGRTAPADAFGTQRGGAFIAPMKFGGYLSGGAPLIYEGFNFYTNPGSATPRRYFAQLDSVPVGSIVDGFTCVYRDTSATNNVTFTLQKAEQVWSIGSNTGASRTNDILVSFTTGGTPGVAYEFVDLPTSETITYFPNIFTTLRQYYITADLADDTSFAGCYVFYTRQVSPAPASASFSDVPTGHPFFQVIEALKASGVTSGCTASTFCPDAPVTRAAMAAFLARALGLAYPY